MQWPRRSRPGSPGRWRRSIPIVYSDALVVKVRDGHQVRNKAAHLAVGVDLDVIKHVLGIWVQAHEGVKFWVGVCTELANRGVRDVLIACCDGLTGFPEIEATFPRTTVQTCVVLMPTSGLCRGRGEIGCGAGIPRW